MQPEIQPTISFPPVSVSVTTTKISTSTAISINRNSAQKIDNMPIYSSSSIIIVQQPINSRSTVTRIYGSSPKDRSTNQYLYSSSPVEDGFFNDVDSDSDMSSTEDCSEDEFELAAADYDSEEEEDFNYNDDSESDAEPANNGYQPPTSFIQDIEFADIPFWFNNEDEGKCEFNLVFFYKFFFEIF